MKKCYSKPEIVFESFTMSTNIAAGCETPTNLPSVNQCGFDFSGLGVFSTGWTGCEDLQPDTSKDFNGICYQNPSDSNNLFTS